MAEARRPLEGFAIVRWRLVLVAVASTFVARPALAYRPFDETDADVTDTGDFELELGPVGYTHDAAGGAYTPGFILNYGIIPRVEIVFDAHHSLVYGGTQVASRRQSLDTALNAKGVVREGCLQGRPGVSVAVEGGALLPTLPASGGVGAALAAIVSERWAIGTVHVNAEGDLTRDRTFAFVVGSILEGPIGWRVRPVAEPLVAKEQGRPAVFSSLGGAIWRVGESLDVDAAFRVARQGSQNIYEARAGLTWTLAL